MIPAKFDSHLFIAMELAQSSQPEQKMFVLFEFRIHIFDITSLTEPYTTFVDNLNCIMQYVIVCLCSDIEKITIPYVHKEHVDIGHWRNSKRKGEDTSREINGIQKMR